MILFNFSLSRDHAPSSSDKDRDQLSTDSIAVAFCATTKGYP